MKGARRWSAMGLVLGAMLGLGLVGVGRTASSPAGSDAAAVRESMAIDVLHRSPMLVSAGETPPLVYELVCATADPKARCAAAGEVYVKALGAPAFARLSLHRDPAGRLVAEPPPGVYARGFEYYAEVREVVSGASRTLPPGGASAPHRVLSVTGREVEVSLGRHRFGDVRAPDATVLRAGWGSGAGQLGLIDGPERARVGAGAFDVAPDGRVVVLDQVNRRLVTYSPAGRVVRSVAIPFSGGIGDLALGPDGSAVVVDDGGTANPAPVVRLIGPDGRHVSSGLLAERTYGLVRWSPLGAVVQQTPSDTWMVATADTRRVLARHEQLRTGLVGRLVPAAGGLSAELVVDGGPHATRYALAAGGRVLAAWKVASATALGEVALVEPYAGGLLVVQRVWTERAAEFVVLHLTPAGVAGSFSVPAVEWAESSSLSRFRLGPDGLYQLRSARAGVSVVRYAMAVAS